MKRTGTVNLPLHGGKAPRWLFTRMVKLAGGITDVIIYEYGIDEFLRRISDPYWFQAFSCVLGFDWHSSGTTTSTCGALKMAIKPEEHGIKVAGGKGKASRKTPEEIGKTAGLFSLSTRKTDELIYSSRMSAKVDNSCIQDGYQLYHHCFIFTEKGDWAVVQQGMDNGADKYARRYHWLSDTVKCFVEEPHAAICSDLRGRDVLDMTDKKSEEASKICLDLVKGNPEHLKKYFKPDSKSRPSTSRPTPQKTLIEFGMEDSPAVVNNESIVGNVGIVNNESMVSNVGMVNKGGAIENFTMPAHHPVLDIDVGRSGMKVLKRAYEIQPGSYEELVSLRGMGPKKIRALALISDLVYGTKPSWRDPVKYSFTVGGKDGFPYPVNRRTYDASIQTLKDAVDQAKLGRKDKLYAVKRLKNFISVN